MKKKKKREKDLNRKKKIHIWDDFTAPAAKFQYLFKENVPPPPPPPQKKKTKKQKNKNKKTSDPQSPECYRF